MQAQDLTTESWKSTNCKSKNHKPSFLANGLKVMVVENQNYQE
jgi:hypothetical protein